MVDIYIDFDDKKGEPNMYATVPYFWDSYDRYR